jgi:formylglycine-generating enzyme required for sulfatase activity
LAQKPGDRYATARIKSCDDARVEQTKEAERERQYTNLIDAADNLFRRGQYTQAKAKYQQALDYQRDDKYATQQIRECDRLYAKAQEEKKQEAVPPGMELIPAGSFMMGSNDGSDDEKPVHEVYVDAFYMDKYEVTVARYQQFLNATGHRTPDNWTEQLQSPNRPAVYVSWDDAVAFCQWLSKQRGRTVRLPTEAEWEYAARGRLSGKKYPWGDEAPDGKANFGNPWSPDWAQGPGKYLKNVGSYGENGYRLFDMAGNVWEWCADLYDENYYENFRNSTARNPRGPTSGTSRVLRGGSWGSNPNLLRCANRSWNNPTYWNYYVGFRCVQDVR